MTAPEIRIVSTPIAAASLLGDLVGADPDCGAIASFVGQVRADGALVSLELEHYPGVTERALQRLACEASARWALRRAVIVHRVGRMAVGDAIVFVGASAPHRHAALDAVGFMIDVLKTQAPFWKRACTATGDHWVAARVDDDFAARRWLTANEDSAT